MIRRFGIRTRLRACVANWMRRTLAETPLVYGGNGTPAGSGAGRLSIAGSTSLLDAIFNVNGGTITIEEHVFFGHGVAILTGAHDHALRDLDRMLQVERDGRDIVIRRGAWLASNVTVLGPCEIGSHAVVAAGAVVVRDVADGEIVGGVPAKHIGWVEGTA